MAHKKLSKKLKEKIKQSPFRQKQSDYSGEALTYLHRVRGAAKARKAKAAKAVAERESKLIINGHEVPEDSQTYIKLAAAASTQNLTVSAYAKKYPKELKSFVSQDRYYSDRETDYLKKDISAVAKKKKKFFINGVEKSAAQVKYRIGRLKQAMINTMDIYDKVIIEHYYDAHNNAHFDLPEISDFAGLDGGEMKEFLNDFYDGTIIFYENPPKGKRKNKK